MLQMQSNPRPGLRTHTLDVGRSDLDRPDFAGGRSTFSDRTATSWQTPAPQTFLSTIFEGGFL